jgi:hypothetical protein
METFGIASVAVITVITYLVGLVGKASSMNDKWIPILCGVCGGLLGAVSYYLAPIPDFPAGDPIRHCRGHRQRSGGHRHQSGCQAAQQGGVRYG